MINKLIFNPPLPADVEIDRALKKTGFLFTVATQPLRIEHAEFDCLLESSETYSSDVTDFPVEDGINIGDHIINKPAQLDMVLYVTSMPVTFSSLFGTQALTRPDDIRQMLIDMRAKKLPVTIVTLQRVYSSMVITNFVFSRTTKEGYAYEIPIAFKQLVTTAIKQVDIPAEYADVKIRYQAAASKQNAGEANIVPTGSAQGGGAVVEKEASMIVQIGGKVKSIIGGLF